MSYLGRVFGKVKGLYNGMNGATLTGAIDVVVVEEEDGSFKCSPFHVRFGKVGVLRSREKVVDIEVNGVVAPLRMKLGDSGEAFFVEEVVANSSNEEEEYLATSPLPHSPQISDSDSDTPFQYPQDTKLKEMRKKRRRSRKSDLLGGTRCSESSTSTPIPIQQNPSHPHPHHQREYCSDTEVEHTTTNNPSRPSSPIQSDSEIEIVKKVAQKEKDAGNWPWGELPSKPVTATTTPVGELPLFLQDTQFSSDNEDNSSNPSPPENKDKSKLSRIFSFMKKGSHQRPQGDPTSAIYLDDLNLEDPKVAALYFPKFGKDEESAGTSLPNIQFLPPGGPKSSLSDGQKESHFKKSLRLNSEQLSLLGLHYGQNEAVFSVTTAYQGTSLAPCHIYLWRHDERVVVSDIDGTISKSDVLGHILPILGRDWAHSGVASLFTEIQKNGYKMLYLSARAIGQASMTRQYLRSIKQGEQSLPEGPLLLNPTSLWSSLHREVIERKPEEFKIPCLKDIQTLFPSNPFYAGYGNRINDVWTYIAVDINISRIFTINHKGELRHALTNSFNSSYSSLVELADHIFPPYKSLDPGCHTEADGYSNFDFWRLPVPVVPEKDTQAK